MKTDDLDDKRRRWVESNISTLLQQRAGIDRKIAEFRAFIEMLEASRGAIGNGQAANKAAPVGLPDLIEAVLREADGRPMTVAGVAEAVERRGWKPRGKNTIKHLVGIELPRQVKLGRRAIVRVAVGQYSSGGPS